ncbi:hypothetical protein SLEP1_g6520 [Rubroshorea leprosula]|uniref:CCHC-type domain-containing protein n=1 Tax=Rubroshorea leprosula TaxID=152421 RepID=A0AAV5I4D3_9ROSI|nr:hypothetical protein SLEP1_g6520 [Rubroshorea leprosula]
MIGSSLRRVLEVDEGFKKAIRVRIDLDVDNPLRRFKTSQITATESRKLMIKYERLLEFCFVCGCLGHVENDCEIAHCIKDAGGKIIKCFGPWLKAELENSWCTDDFDVLDEAFSANTQILVGEKGIDVTKPSENEEIQSLNNMPICGRQVEGGNNENSINEVETNQSRVVLPLIAKVQLVDVPLSQQFGDMSNHRGKGKNTKANKSSWKRIDRVGGSMLHTEEHTQNKWRSFLTPMEEERTLKVLVDNTGVALAQLAKRPLPFCWLKHVLERDDI